MFVPSLPWQLVGVHLGNWKEKTNSLLFAGSGTGKCTLYETIDGRPAADNNTQSGIQTGPVELIVGILASDVALPGLPR